MATKRTPKPKTRASKRPRKPSLTPKASTYVERKGRINPQMPGFA